MSKLQAVTPIDKIDMNILELYRGGEFILPSMVKGFHYRIIVTASLTEDEFILRFGEDGYADHMCTEFVVELLREHGDELVPVTIVGETPECKENPMVFIEGIHLDENTDLNSDTSVRRVLDEAALLMVGAICMGVLGDTTQTLNDFGSDVRTISYEYPYLKIERAGNQLSALMENDYQSAMIPLITGEAGALHYFFEMFSMFETNMSNVWQYKVIMKAGADDELGSYIKPLIAFTESVMASKPCKVDLGIMKYEFDEGKITAIVPQGDIRKVLMDVKHTNRTFVLGQLIKLVYRPIIQLFYRLDE